MTDQPTNNLSSQDSTDRVGASGGVQPGSLARRPMIAADEARALAGRIEEAAGIQQKADLLWALPTLQRHAAMGALHAETLAAVIESNPEENTALLGNLPAQKFVEIINLGAPDNGRRWLERAMESKMLAAQILPALMPTRDLMMMLMTSAEYRSALSGLLNFRRAEELRSILHPLEWKSNLNDLLLADAEELLLKSPIRDRNIRAILQSLVDFYPELYLTVVRESLEYAKYQEDRAEELADLVDMPLAMPEFLNDAAAEPLASEMAGAESPAMETPQDKPAKPRRAGASAANDLVPTAGDPFLQLATAQLPVDRRDQLEAELKDLLRREILATGSFSQADLLRAAGRLLFQIRAGLLQSGADTPDAAAQILISKTFADVVLLGARAAERYRQRALQLAGVRDWLDRNQRQLLNGMNTLEPGMDPETGEPSLYLASRPGQPRDEWSPTPLRDVDEQLDDIQSWSALARAAFGTPARVQSIFAASKTRTAVEAVRRTVIALCLYRRWEPELVNPPEDLPAFKAEFTDNLGRLDPAREVVLAALDATPAEAWRGKDARQRAQTLLMGMVDALETNVKITEAPARETAEREGAASDDSAS